MILSLSEVLHSLEQSSLAIAIRQSAWLYPFLEIIHILGIVMLAGAAFIFDLRLLGFSTHLSIDSLSRHLFPLARRALFLIIPSGTLLFLTNAAALGYDRVFWLKMILLVLAAINAFIFHKVALQEKNTQKAVAKDAAKFMAAVSIVLWTAIIACGRLLAY